MKCIEDEIPFEVPEGWAWSRIFSISQDLPYGTSKKSSSSGEIAVLRMGNLQQGEIDYTDLVYSSNKEDIDKYLLTDGDLLFNRTNSSEWVGKTAIYRGETAAIYAGYLIRIRSLLDAEYLNSVMNSKYIKEICFLVKTDAINQSNINAAKLGSFLIPIPPSKEQIRIANKLSDILYWVNYIVTGKLELQQYIHQIKSKILDLAIQGKFVPQDPNDEPASVLLERIRAEKEELIKQRKIKRDKKESVIFRGEDNSYYLNDGNTIIDISDEIPFIIPDSWSWGKLKDIVIINPRNKLADDTEVAFVPMSLIEDGYSGNHTSEIRKWKDVKTGFTHFKERDIGVAKITPCFENRKSVIFRNLCNGYGAGTTELHMLRSYKNTILPEYLLAYVKTNQFIENGKQTFSGVVGQQRIGKEYIENAYFPIPPIKEQYRIAKKIEDLFSYLNTITNALT